MEGMANTGEPLLSRRNGRQAKEAERLEPKGKWRGRGATLTPLADVVPPADRRGLSPSGTVLVRNVVSPIVSIRRWKVARKGVPVDEGVRDAGGSEGRAVMVRIGVCELPCPERELTSGRSWITRKERKGSTVGLLKTMRPVASLKARRALCQSSTNPYREGVDVCHRVLRGALSRLEPSAVKVACSVLRGLRLASA